MYTKKQLQNGHQRGSTITQREIAKDGETETKSFNGLMQTAKQSLSQLSVQDVSRFQYTMGNQAVGRLLISGHSQRTSSDNASAIQRQNSGLPSTDARRILAQKILTHLRAGGGITVSVYVSQLKSKGKQVKGASEFRRHAIQYACDHQAVGIAADGNVRIGTAMELTNSLPATLQTLSNKIGELLSNYPDLTGSQSFLVPISRMAIFTHGELRTQDARYASGLEAGAMGTWIGTEEARQVYTHWQSVASWIEAVAPYFSSSPSIVLFACEAGGTPPRGMPFAEAMRLALQSELERKYGEDTEVAPEVWGHTTEGHTTRNPNLIRFFGGASAGSQLLTEELGRSLASASIERAGVGENLPEYKRRLLEERAETDIAAMFKQTGTSPLDPMNSYIREIPSLGINRVWTHLSSSQTADISDLRLSPEAEARVLQGLDGLRSKLLSKLEKLSQDAIRLSRANGGLSSSTSNSGF